jgi:hypothetical protein
MRCGHPNFYDLKSSRDKDRSRKALMSRWDSSARNRSISRVQTTVSYFTPTKRLTSGILTRFAGFVLNFSKIFCDWDFEASAAILRSFTRWRGLNILVVRGGESAIVANLLLGMFRWNLCRGDRSGPDCDWDLVSCRFTEPKRLARFPT